MAILHHNLSGEITKKLVQAGAGINIKKISFTNIHADTTCTVDLWIEKKLTGKYYLLKSVSLPVGVTLIYSDGIDFNTNTNQFSLFVKLTKGASETPTVDVIIN
jgi:hypothetical protein